jgi:preprotein translocase subunit SecY
MSIIDVFTPIYRLLPVVKQPEKTPAFKNKIIISLAVLLLFYIMGTIPVIGLETSTAGALERLQIILASQIGTILSVGIGPIVLASIILQLLVGGGLLNIDLSDQTQRAKYMSLQKLFAITLCFFEAIAYALTGMLMPEEGMLIAVVLQVAFGSIALLYLDEVVSKWGIGSGIGLFIAGGVSQNVFWVIFNPFNEARQLTLIEGQGLLFLFIQNIGGNMLTTINFYLLPIIFMLIVFFTVVFFEGMHVSIPITMGKRGIGGKYPVKFLYVSNIPVILAAALFANVMLWASLTKEIPIIGTILQKLSTAVTAPYGIRENFITQLITNNPLTLLQQIGTDIVQSILTITPIGLGGEIIHAIIYITILVAICMVFGKFWVEMAGQGPEAIANQLQKSGMYLPGFRRDPRVIRKVLDRYIPPITLLGSAFVGILAGFADLTGAVGSGTGILLTVGIVYRLYEEIAKAQITETHPLLGKLLSR